MVLSSLCLGDDFIWVEGIGHSNSDFADHSWFNNVNQDLLSQGIPCVVDGDWHINHNMVTGADDQAADVFDVT